MFRLLSTLILIISSLPHIFGVEIKTADLKEGPFYKFRHESQDVMKTAASTVPLRSYSVVEGNYPYEGNMGMMGGSRFGGFNSMGGMGSGLYGSGMGKMGFGSGMGGYGTYGGGYGYGPQSFGMGGLGMGGPMMMGNYPGSGMGMMHHTKLGGLGGMNGFGYGGLGYGGMGYGGMGYGGLGYGGMGYGGLGYGGMGYGGGQVVDKNVYSDAKKNMNDESYEKVSGKKSEEAKGDQKGFVHGKAVATDVKGDSGYYNDVHGGKKKVEDGKMYDGAQQFSKEAVNGGEKKMNKGHKKGHKIKGFKTSHHKDESGKTEEFYDEENDEGADKFFDAQKGEFGEKAASSFKGGHEDGQFNAGQSKKEGHYNQEHLVDNSKANQEGFGQNKYAGSGEIYGVNNGLGEQSLLGHQETNRFYKHHPHTMPFYGSGAY